LIALVGNSYQVTCVSRSHRPERHRAKVRNPGFATDKLPQAIRPEQKTLQRQFASAWRTGAPRAVGLALVGSIRPTHFHRMIQLVLCPSLGPKNGNWGSAFLAARVSRRCPAMSG